MLISISLNQHLSLLTSYCQVCLVNTTGLTMSAVESHKGTPFFWMQKSLRESSRDPMMYGVLPVICVAIFVMFDDVRCRFDVGL